MTDTNHPLPADQPLRPRSIDLNADLGEGFPNDEAMLELVCSAGICCGAHAGGRDESLATMEAALRLGVVIGAHPGFPDRAGFGRSPRSVSAGEVNAILREQLGRFLDWAAELGASVRFVKPHGALYNQGQVDPEIASGIIEAVSVLRLPVLGLPGGEVEREARNAGLRFVAEGFTDRRYRPDGTLVPRREPDALIADPSEAEQQAIALVFRGIDTLCLHGDDPNAIEFARRLRGSLSRAGVALRSFVDDRDSQP